MEPHLTPAIEAAEEASPLLRWLRDTSGPAPDLEALRRGLVTIPGSLSDAVEHERQGRL